MKLNLRKAKALQEEIQSVLKDLKLKPEIEITEFTANISGAIYDANTKYHQDITRIKNLVEALYELRKLVSSANETNNINTLLADIACLDRLYALYNASMPKIEPESLSVVEAKIAKIKDAPQSSRVYGYKDSVTVSCVDIDSIKDTISSLKKRKRELQDQLLSLNVKVEIVLGERYVNVLKEEGII